MQVEKGLMIISEFTCLLLLPLPLSFPVMSLPHWANTCFMSEIHPLQKYSTELVTTALIICSVLNDFMAATLPGV